MFSKEDFEKVGIDTSKIRNGKGICPKCGKPLTVGVMYRVDELADRPPQVPRPDGLPPYRSLVPLAELIAETMGVGKASKRVKTALGALVQGGLSEFTILLDLPIPELAKLASPEVTAAVQNMREGRVEIRPGYDGEFGRVKISGVKKKKQAELF